MAIAVKSRTENGITRPRLVAHSLQMARLLEGQRKQLISGQTMPLVPYAHDAYIAGAMLYFMIEHIGYCNLSQACDPSQGALFHWVDDTFRRVELLSSANSDKIQALLKERGNIVQFLLEEKPSFESLATVTQSVTPYDFALYMIPYADRLKNERVSITSKEEFTRMLQHVLGQYVTDGMALLQQYQKQQQIFDMRLLLRSMVTMRALARGFGKAAWTNHDYLVAAQAFAFSGDINKGETKTRLLQLIEQEQNAMPETCEQILKAIDQSQIDWFSNLRQIYQNAVASSSLSVAVASS